MNNVVIRNRRDILKYLEDNPRNTPRVGILFAIALTSVFADAYDLGSLSIGVTSLTNDLGLTATQVGIITSSTAIGALVSALAGGMIADRTGRYRLFIICAILLVIAPIGVAVSVNFWMVLFFRIVLGIAVGLDMPVAFSFMAELLTKETSAKFINFWQPVSSFSNILGVAIALPFALGAVTSHIWRFTVGFGALIAIVALVLRLKYSEESPLWSAKHQNLIKAAKVLETTYDIQVRLEPDGTDDLEPDPRKLRYGVGQLFRVGQLPKTILVSICAFCQQLQYYGIGFYVPLIAGMVFGHDMVSTIISTVCAQAVALVAGLIGGPLDLAPRTTPTRSHRLLHRACQPRLDESCRSGQQPSVDPPHRARLLHARRHCVRPRATVQDPCSGRISHRDPRYGHRLVRDHGSHRLHHRSVLLPRGARGRRGQGNHADHHRLPDSGDHLPDHRALGQEERAQAPRTDGHGGLTAPSVGVRDEDRARPQFFAASLPRPQGEGRLRSLT